MDNSSMSYDNLIYHSNCQISYENFTLQGVNETFHKYVIPSTAAVGISLHVAFWCYSLLKPMPPLSLYKRLLLVLSCMDFLQLTSHLLESSRHVAAGISVWLFGDGALQLVVAFLPFVLRTFSSFTGMLLIVWICINCSHDINHYSFCVTGDLLKGFKDRRCLLSLTVIFVISVSLTTILQIQRRFVRGPYCYRNRDNKEELIRYWTVNKSTYGFVIRLIEALIFIVFVAVLMVEVVSIVMKLRRQFAKRSWLTSTISSSSQGNRGGDTRNSDQNEIHLAAYFLVLPMCAYYILCWTPKRLIDLINVLTNRIYGEAQVNSELVIWLLSTMLLLTSVFDPITFSLATWKYHRGVDAATNPASTARTRREIQETNV